MKVESVTVGDSLIKNLSLHFGKGWPFKNPLTTKYEGQPFFKSSDLIRTSYKQFLYKTLNQKPVFTSMPMEIGNNFANMINTMFDVEFHEEMGNTVHFDGFDIGFSLDGLYIGIDEFIGVECKFYNSDVADKYIEDAAKQLVFNLGLLSKCKSVKQFIFDKENFHVIQEIEIDASFRSYNGILVVGTPNEIKVWQIGVFPGSRELAVAHYAQKAKRLMPIITHQDWDSAMKFDKEQAPFSIELYPPTVIDVNRNYQR